jgi:hypothetical protein
MTTYYETIVLNEMEIPHFVRDDTFSLKKRRKQGRFAPANLPCFLHPSQNEIVIPNGAKRNEESHTSLNKRRLVQPDSLIFHQRRRMLIN